MEQMRRDSREDGPSRLLFAALAIAAVNKIPIPPTTTKLNSAPADSAKAAAIGTRLSIGNKPRLRQLRPTRSFRKITPRGLLRGFAYADSTTQRAQACTKKYLPNWQAPSRDIDICGQGANKMGVSPRL